MRWLLAPLLPVLASAAVIQHSSSDAFDVQESLAYKFPTIHESAVLGRRILRLEGIGHLATMFPTHTPDVSTDDAELYERRPSSVEGLPIGLMDYIGDCENEGNPTILALTVATSFKNAAAGSNVSLSIMYNPPNPTHPHRYQASLPRMSLVGYLEDMDKDDVEDRKIASCYVDQHPDAKWWLPGNSIHFSKFTRLVVQEIYWIGGFGDRAYIGWIPLEEWQSVTQKEIDNVKLPGEH